MGQPNPWPCLVYTSTIVYEQLTAAVDIVGIMQCGPVRQSVGTLRRNGQKVRIWQAVSKQHWLLENQLSCFWKIAQLVVETELTEV